MTVASRAIHHASLLVIPHPGNDHRPYALRHKPLAFVSTLLVAGKILALSILTLTPITADLSTITSARILQLTNTERTNRGLNALITNEKLSRAAAAKGHDMLTHQYFAHFSPTGVSPWYWMVKQNYTYQIAGENLAIDFTNAEDVVTAWLNSPSHKENMLLPDYTETGIAVVTGEFEGNASTIVVHMFGKPTVEAAVTGQVASQVSARTAVATSTPKPSVTPSPTPAASPSATPTPSATTLPIPIPPLPPQAPGQLPASDTGHFIISPQTDQALFTVENQGKLKTAQAITSASGLAPTFTNQQVEGSSQAPGRLAQLIRRLTFASLAVIAILLTLAIFIRIRIQRPALIAHASFVMLLATCLLFL